MKRFSSDSFYVFRMYKLIRVFPDKFLRLISQYLFAGRTDIDISTIRMVKTSNVLSILR